MPTYDFKCRKCGRVFERTQGMNEANPGCDSVLGEGYSGSTPMGVVTCGGDTDKLFTRAAPVHFQGGGWAKDLYAKKG